MPKAASIDLETELPALPGLSASALKMLTAEKLHTVGDLILNYPYRHEDRRHLGFSGFSPSEAPVCYAVRIKKTKVMRFGSRGGFFEAVTVPSAEVTAFDEELTLRWFNMSFLQKALAVDMQLMIYGKIKDVKGRLIMAHPEYEVLSEDPSDPEASIHTRRIVPVYRLRGSLKQKALRAATWRALQILDDDAIPLVLPPPKSDGEFAGQTRARALRQMHQPDSLQEVEAAKRYLALEEFYLMQLQVVRRRRLFKEHAGWSQKPPGKLLAAFLENLPFELTGAQLRSLDEIREDMADPRPMNRLLHGDVGSGKTVVALAAMLVAVEAGQQAALMAPTQILAQQHYQQAVRWLEPLGVRVGLRTGERDEVSGEMPLFAEAATSLLPDQGHSEPHVMIGTHALLYEKTALPKLGLAVIDEQHKFGVAQRARLIEKGKAPDVLVMTATPIPRTLTLTVYGDLDVSSIDERPKARGKIITAIRETTKLDDVAKFVNAQILEGRQCFIVYPLIEESEKRESEAAVKGFASWSKTLAPHAVGLLHGRLDADAKDDIMRRFRSGELKALVSTTVIEVGVDVPNATIMVIHDAARFGLAQLHQLRGRIGRGEHTSYCVLFIAKDDAEGKERLRILEETADGFRIAEEDLRRRGPGDIIGMAQSGQAPLRFAALLGDMRLVTLARSLAERTLSQDPGLADPSNALLRRLTLETAQVDITLQ